MTYNPADADTQPTREGTLVEPAPSNQHTHNDTEDTTGSTVGTTPGGLSDYTDDEATRFNGLPGMPEVWKNSDTGEMYVVYYPEGQEPPIPLLFTISTQDELKSLFGDQTPSFDKELTSEQIMGAGSIAFGEMASIDRYNDQGQLIRDPWAGFTSRMERAKDRFPWFEEDPEVFAIVAGAYLEGREVEDWELEGTDYFQAHGKAERDAMRLLLSDPETYEDRHNQFYSKVFDSMAAYGVQPNERVAGWVAGELNAGRWTMTDAEAQLQAFYGYGGTQEINEDFQEFIDSEAIETGGATAFQDTVRSLYEEWLGPAFPPDEASIVKWAGMMTDSQEGGTDALVAFLRKQRLALFPNYENENLSYADIAAPWRSFTQRVWGVPVDDTDVEFQKILQLNDAVEAQKQARKVGSDRGYQAVVEDMQRQLEQSMRIGVRGDVF